MIRLAVFFGYLLVTLVGLVPELSRLKRLNPDLPALDYDARVHPVVKKWNRGVMKVAGARVEVQGDFHLPAGAAMLVSNHEGNFDVPACIGYISKPFGFVAKTEMKKIPLLSAWMKLIHCLFINRTSRRNAAITLRDGTHLLKSGYSLFIFPEGTRNRGGALLPFKAGAFRMAKEAQVPIIPLALYGTAQLFEHNSGRKLTPACVRISILAPVMPADYKQLDSKQLAAAVQKRIQGELEKMKTTS